MEESSGETGAGSSEGTVSHVLRDDHGSGCARKEFLVENAKKEEHGHRSLKPSKRLELLVRLNRAYPDRWCESSLKQLLRNLAIAKLACSRENVPRTMEQIEEEFLFSLAQICAMQHEKLMASQTAISEKEKKFISAIMSLQQEKSEIKQGLARQNMDFDEIAKALENSRQKQRQLEQLLEQKDTDLHLLISEKEELVNKFVTSGSDAVLKGEGKFQDSVNAETSAYDLLGRGGGSKENNNMCDDISSTYIAFHNGSKSIINTQRDDFVTRLSSFDGKRPTLLFVILNGIFEEGLVSVLTVVESGIFALPSAVAHFWLGVTSRVARHVSETVVRTFLPLRKL